MHYIIILFFSYTTILISLLIIIYGHISFYSYKLDRSDDIYHWSDFCRLNPLFVYRHSEIHNKKRTAYGENSLSVHTKRVPGKWSITIINNLIYRILYQLPNYYNSYKNDANFYNIIFIIYYLYNIIFWLLCTYDVLYFYYYL